MLCVTTLEIYKTFNAKYDIEDVNKLYQKYHLDNNFWWGQWKKWKKKLFVKVTTFSFQCKDHVCRYSGTLNIYVIFIIYEGI